MIGLGSALGGMGRYGISHWMAVRFGDQFPWGTVTVNVVGSFMIGLFFTLTTNDGRLLVDTAWRQAVLVGFCGGFTTFSTFSFQVMQQLRNNEWLGAGWNIGLSLILCLIAVFGGAALGRWINLGGWTS